MIKTEAELMLELMKSVLLIAKELENIRIAMAQLVLEMEERNVKSTDYLGEFRD